ncbi:TPA: hypothetical protein U1B16_000889 [Streptococcus suis]|nr:hypothetical protein [Streptococcus suis]
MMEWIKFTTRALEGEEIELYPHYDFMWDCQVPDIGEIVLVSDGKKIWTDEWDEVGEGQDLSDGDAEGLYWMPLPEPPKEVE